MYTTHHVSSRNNTETKAGSLFLINVAKVIKIDQGHKQVRTGYTWING
jgi:hypothetical protein